VLYHAWLDDQGVWAPGERVLVMRDDPPDTYANTDIIVPDTEKQKPRRGHILMIGQTVGPEYGLRPGMTVLFNKYHTLTLQLPHLSGEPQEVEAFHPVDLYLVWPEPEEENHGEEKTQDN
jgi:co-chaperonin GroES (HSP10)